MSVDEISDVKNIFGKVENINKKTEANDTKELQEYLDDTKEFESNDIEELLERLEKSEIENFLNNSQYYSKQYFDNIISEIDKISLSLDKTNLDKIKENLKKEIKDISDNIYNLYQSLDAETQKKRGANIQNSSKVKLSREIHKLFDSFKANYNIKESKMCVSNFREKYLKKGNEQELAKILKCNDIKALKQYLGTPDEFGYYFKFETILSWL